MKYRIFSRSFKFQFQICALHQVSPLDQTLHHGSASPSKPKLPLAMPARLHSLTQCRNWNTAKCDDRYKVHIKFQQRVLKWLDSCKIEFLHTVANGWCSMSNLWKVRRLCEDLGLYAADVIRAWRHAGRTAGISCGKAVVGSQERDKNFFNNGILFVLWCTGTFWGWKTKPSREVFVRCSVAILKKKSILYLGIMSWGYQTWTFLVG